MSTMHHRQAGGVSPLRMRYDHETPRLSQVSRQTLRRSMPPIPVGPRPESHQPERETVMGEPAAPETPTTTWPFDTDIVFVVAGLALSGIAWWLHSGDVETAGILFAALAAYAAWLDGEHL